MMGRIITTISVIVVLLAIGFNAGLYDQLQHIYHTNDAVLSWNECIKTGFKDYNCKVIPTVSWKSAPNNISQATSSYFAGFERPLLLKNTPAGEWNILEEWDSLGKFESSFGPDTEIDFVANTTSKTVLYGNPSMPFSKSNKLNWKPSFEHTKMKMKDLIKAIQENHSAFNYYYSGDVKVESSLVSLKNQIPDTTPFHVDWPGKLKKNDQQFHMWIGTPGINSRTHYDQFENFYIQLIGKKQFMLYPPSEWRNLHLFPVLHPSGRHSQYEPNSEMEHTFEFSKELKKPFVVTLNPGDVLYLPPFWFHHVLSIEPSLSVNVWTDSYKSTIVSKLTNNAMDFIDEGFPEYLYDVAAAKLVVLITSKLPNGQQLLKDLIVSQFESMPFEKDPGDNHLVMNHSCKSLSTKVTSQLPQKLDQYLEQRAEEIVSDFNSFGNEGITGIVYSVMIPGIAHWSVLNVEDVIQYLNCIRNMIEVEGS